MTEGAAPPHIELFGVRKHFDGTRALTDVSLSISHGVVHALVGENGAGKSTLGKIVAGALRADEGVLEMDGEEVVLRSPRDALARGIAAVQQEISLVSQRTVLDNVFLGIELVRRGAVDVRSMRARFEELNESSGFALPADKLVAELGVADQQKVEILRALAQDSRLLVMDEPTARLSVDESTKLLEVVRTLRAREVTIVYVSHFLEEVLSIADIVTVLRNGEVVQTGSVEGKTPDDLVTAMLGRPASLTFPERRTPPEQAPVVLSVRGITRRGLMQDISFEIKQGEIVGLAGLVGSGRTEVARAIFGADRYDAGVIELSGKRMEVRHPRHAIAAGIAMLPESRKDQGLLMRQPIGHNVTLPHLDLLSHGGFIDRDKEEKTVTELLRRLDVKPARTKLLLSSLSGGNQQKVLFSKWLYRGPRVLIADEPTRGVDVGAKRAIYELISSLAATGMAVLLISSEFEEVLGLAHRVLVMRRGRIVAEFEGAGLSQEPVLRAAFGSSLSAGGEVA